MNQKSIWIPALSRWLMGLGIMTTLACSSTSNSSPMSNPYQNRPQFLEILHWTHADGVDPTLSVRSMRGFAVEMNKYGTLARKDFANNQSKWFSVNYWQDEAAKNRINAEAKNWESNKVFFPAISPGSFALADYVFDYAPEEDALSKGPAQVLEVVYLKKQESASDAALAELLHRLTPKLNGDGALMDRVVAKSERGDWLLLNYWSTYAANQDMNAQSASWPENQAFAELVDINSLKLETYFLRSPKEPEEAVIEIAVRAVKDGQQATFEAQRSRFIETWMNNDGAEVDREFASTFGMPNTPQAKFVGMTSWASQAAFQQAGQNPEVGAVAPDFMGTFDMLAFVTARPIEGDFNLASLVQQEGQVLELAIRRIKDPSQAKEFHRRRKAYVAKLGEVEGVLASYELEVVMSNSGEHLTVGMTEYADRAAVDRAGKTVNQGPEAAAFLELMEVVTFNYLTKVK